MDEDGKITDGEESQEPTIEHKPYSKDRLVLYHWTQSFSSQKVRKTQHEMVGDSVTMQWDQYCQIILRFLWMDACFIGLPVCTVLYEDITKPQQKMEHFE